MNSFLWLLFAFPFFSCMTFDGTSKPAFKKEKKKKTEKGIQMSMKNPIYKRASVRQSHTKIKFILLRLLFHHGWMLTIILEE